MRSLSNTISHLRRFRMPVDAGGVHHQAATLTPLADIGSNPGDLRGWLHVPVDMRPGATLVVVLHGCTQTAADYDRGSGWSALADRYGFAVLFPEQQRANNPNLCFNWFVPADIRRDGGEAASIRAMVEGVVARHQIDRARIFVTGLSAGGAMTSVMLATCPDLFAGGAVIAGLSYGVADNVPQALERMRGIGHDRASDGRRIRAASTHRGPWPTISVWHGDADRTVDIVNAAVIVDAWRALHGVDAPDTVDRVDGHAHRAWHDAAGRMVIEDYRIAGLGHGTPVTTRGNMACGTPGPHMLEAGISSTWRIAASWGLVPDVAPPRPADPVPPPPSAAPADQHDPSAIIGQALRAAGLLKS